MTSPDNTQYVTVEMLNQRFTNIDNTLVEIQSDMQEIKAEVQAIGRKMDINNAKLDAMKASLCWGFAIIALMLCMITVIYIRKVWH